MAEIDLILDIQPSPDTPELIVTKHRAVAEGNVLKLVGQPRQERLSIGMPRVRMTLGERADHRIGYVMTVNVSNVGMSPLDIKSVAFVFPQNRQGPEGNPVHTSFCFEPIAKLEGPLLPAHTRTYYLPMEYYEVVVQNTRIFQPDQYYIAAFIGDKEIGRIDGFHIRPFLDRSHVDVSARAQIAFDAIHEPEKIRLLALLSDLAASDPQAWNREIVQRFDDVSQLYVVRVSPDLRAIVVPAPDRHINLVDLVRTETLKQFVGAAEAGPQK